MNSRTRIAVAAGLAGLVGLAGLAGVAEADKRWQQRGEHRMHGDRHHMGSRMHHRIRDFAERYDTNKDGKISQEEIDTNRTEWLVEFDVDKDGTLTLKEFEGLWLKARHERMVREYQEFDRDGDGKVTLDEYKLPLSDLVERLDRNDDGVLSKEDRPRRQRSGDDKDEKGGDDE